MLKKPESNLKDPSDKRTPEEIAEERIANWIRDPTWSKLMSDERRAEFHKRFGARTPDLDLSGLGLGAIPESLRHLRNVELVNLSNNKIRELPRWIGELSSLRALDLGENQLQTLPPELGSLHGLIGLFLWRNQLKSS
jgi:Leucine-rich repeat (LRR) protein